MSAAPLPLPGQPGEPTVNDVIEAYLRQKEGEHAAGYYTRHSLERARFYLRSFAAAFGTRNVAEARKGDLTRWVLENPAWKSPSTKNDAVAAVVSCMRFAEDEGLIDRNPYRRPARPPWPPPAPRAALTAQEYRAIMAAARRCAGKAPPAGHHYSGRRRLVCGDRARRRRPSRTAFRLALYFLFATGARTCEMRRADWSQLDWAAGVIRQEAHKTARTTGKPRLIPLGARVLRVLRWVHRRRGFPAAGHIFLNSRGRPWDKNQLARRFREYARLAGVRETVSAYSARHGYTVAGLRRGVGDRQLADALGQRGTTYIGWYGRDAQQEPEYLRAVAEQVAGRAPSAVPAAPAQPPPAAAALPDLPAGSCAAAVLAALAVAPAPLLWQDICLAPGGGRGWAATTVRQVLGKLFGLGLIQAEGWPRRYSLERSNPHA